MKIPMKELGELPIYLSVSLLAVFGGVARYAINYKNGAPFKIGILIASIVGSAFAGIIFALVGVSMNLPQPIIWMMAGTGGFFSEQSIKLVYELVKAQAKK